MKRGTVVTVHKCICCSKEYDTKAKAAACSKYEVSFKKGDLIMWNNRPWTVASDSDGTSLFPIERVDAYHKASGFGARQG